MSGTLDDILAKLNAMDPKARKALEVEVKKATKGMKFIPNVGAQTDAWFSPADLMLYGGAGGGGKSSLIVGLALSSHQRSLVMRRQYSDLAALTDEAIQFNGTRSGFNGSPPQVLRATDGRLIEFGACAIPGSEESWQGRAHDFLGVDEAAQFLEGQIRFLMGWVRSTDKKQRCRTVLASNPPLSADGQWLIPMFRPWLDLTHPNPAKPGELRWFVTDPDGNDMEVDDKRPVELDGKTLIPKSRTFIPAKLSDNPFLVNTGYQATLDALPEPIRSAVRDGNFMAARKDADRQVIPSEWIRAAQARWTPRGGLDEPMTAMALDPAGGGADKAELARRHGGWYAEMVSMQGEETADGSKTAGMVAQHRRNNCPVVVDVGGGYGGAVTLRFRDNGIPFVAFNGSGESHRKTKDGTLKFANKRAEAWWRFREELDPDQEGGSVIALPPDPELSGDLSAPTWDLGARGIIIEPKVKFGPDGKVSGGLKRRLGRSPGKGDAVVMALSEGNRAVMRVRMQEGFFAEEQSHRNQAVVGGPNGRAPRVVLGHQAARR
jgi:hypothetical protein